MDFYIDTYEPEKCFRYAKDFSPKKVPLIAGDYTMQIPTEDNPSPIGIERKKVSDLINSINSGRLDKQIRKMSIYYNIRVLMIVGDLEKMSEILRKHHHQINEYAVYCKIASIMVRNNFHIFWARNDKGAVEAAYKICRSIAEGKYNLPKITIKTPRNLLYEIPGINKSIGNRIRKKFQTIQKLSNATPEELKEIKGVGDKRANQIYSYFRLRL